MKFSAFNLKKDVVNCLNQLNYITPTSVQEVVIPKALKGESVVVQSETGTGKTHSFLIPIINNVEYNGKIQALVISPTRELARQTYIFAKQFCKHLPKLKVKMFVSGEDSKKDLNSFKNEAEIIIATPGKLNYLIENSDIDLTNIKTLVLDEADMLMEDSFLSDIDKIIKKLVKPQIEVFSATINKKVEFFLKKYISADYVLTISKGRTSKTVNHYFINTKHSDLLESVMKFISIKNPFLLLIFTNSKEETKKLYTYLCSQKLKCGILSGDLKSRERRSMLRRINAYDFQIVVCTDIASRGLDINDVTDVLSIGLPNNLEYYYHRAGRTGRNYKEGNSFVFYDSDHVELPLKLIDNGLTPAFLKFKDYELVE
ncbi:MAG: DEAD/DEAH box helicase, partial [Erysipelotrichaceae bacterium]|nr:DEAD/DEAH box helicase [Erysipelotrichaceae bacterium]